MRLVHAPNMTVTYEEIRRFWDINEVMRANEMLDIQADAEWLQARDMQRKQARR